MQHLSYYDAACPLREKLTKYRPVYYWLEYWGDWLGGEGDREYAAIAPNPLARLISKGKDYIKATGDDVWNDDLRILERCLAPLKNSQRAFARIDPGHTNLHRLLYRLHNRKYSLDQIAMDERLHYKTLDTKLSEAYAIVTDRMFELDDGMYHRQPPAWR